MLKSLLASFASTDLKYYFHHSGAVKGRGKWAIAVGKHLLT